MKTWLPLIQTRFTTIRVHYTWLFSACAWWMVAGAGGASPAPWGNWRHVARSRVDYAGVHRASRDP